MHHNLKKNSYELRFQTSASPLQRQIIQIGFKENKVMIPADTIITSEELAPGEQVRVSRILWELIWNHKIFLLFGRSDLLGLSNGEDRFVKY